MDEAARDQLARRLSAMSLNDARKEIRALDPQAELKFYRNAIWDELHTLWLLPNAGLSITLVEKDKEKVLSEQAGGTPRGTKKLGVDFTYVEARVAPLDRPAFARVGRGPLSDPLAEQREVLQAARRGDQDHK